MSVVEIARLAKIQPKYLLALESGEYENLPSPVYVKGFLKSLSGIYGISLSNLLVQYEAEKGLLQNLEPLERDTQQVPVRQFVFSPKTLTLAGLAVLGALSLSYLYFQVSSLHRPPSLVVISPEADGMMDTSLVVLKGHTEPGAAVYLNNQPLVVDVNGNFQENLSLAPGTNLLAIKSVNKFGKENTVTRAVAVVDKRIAGLSDSATTTPPVTAGIEFELIVGAQPAWVSLSVDGEQLYSGTMLAGATRTVHANEKMVLSTSNAGSMRVIMNGKDLGFLGKDGETLEDVEFSK